MPTINECRRRTAARNRSPKVFVHLSIERNVFPRIQMRDTSHPVVQIPVDDMCASRGMCVTSNPRMGQTKVRPLQSKRVTTSKDEIHHTGNPVRQVNIIIPPSEEEIPPSVRCRRIALLTESGVARRYIDDFYVGVIELKLLLSEIITHNQLRLPRVVLSEKRLDCLFEQMYSGERRAEAGNKRLGHGCGVVVGGGVVVVVVGGGVVVVVVVGGGVVVVVVVGGGVVVVEVVVVGWGVVVVVVVVGPVPVSPPPPPVGT